MVWVNIKVSVLGLDSNENSPHEGQSRMRGLNLRKLVNETSIDEVPSEVLTKILVKVNAVSGSYYTSENSQKELVLRARIPCDDWAKENIDNLTIEIGRGLVGRAMLRRISVFEKDVSFLDSNQYVQLSDKVVSELAIPLFRDSSLIGVVCIDWDRRFEPQQSMIDMLQSELSRKEVGDALENVHLFRRLKQEQGRTQDKNKFLQRIGTDRPFSRQSAYDKLASMIMESFGLAACSIGVYNEFEGAIAVKSVAPVDKGALLETVRYKADDSLTGIAIKSNEVKESRDVQIDPLFKNPRFARELDLHRAYVIPLETFEGNESTSISKKTFGNLNIYPKGIYKRVENSLIAFLKQISENEIQHATLIEKLETVQFLRDIFIRTSKLAASNGSRVTSFCKQIAPRIREIIECEGVSIFVVDPYTLLYILEGTTGLEGDPDPHTVRYSLGEGLTGHLLEQGVTMVIPDVTKHPHFKGKFKERTDHNKRSFLGVCLKDHNGKVIGAIRCTNKVPQYIPERVDAFSQDDKEMLEYIAFWIDSFLEIQLAEQAKQDVIMKSAHESRSQLGGIITKSEEVIAFLKRDMPRSGKWLKYVEDIRGHATFLTRKLNTTELSDSRILLNPERTLIWKDVIIPVVTDSKFLCEESELPHRKIDYGQPQDIRSVPPLWIDREKFQDVFHNLISNAIKYSYNDENAFQINILPVVLEDKVQIKVQDYGIGIDESEVSLIFLRGYRSPRATRDDVGGKGLGLYIVRNIIEMHSGKIEVTRPRFPTEFTISLPRTLSRPWRQKR